VRGGTWTSEGIRSSNIDPSDSVLLVLIFTDAREKYLVVLGPCTLVAWRDWWDLRTLHQTITRTLFGVDTPGCEDATLGYSVHIFLMAG